VKANLKIAFIGTKGIPAKWGGIEQYVEEVTTRLAQRGHAITVFGSKWYCKDYQHSCYHGVKIVRVPSLHLQATDALTNGMFSMMKVLGGRYDIVHFHGASSYYYLPMIKMFGNKVIVTVHAMESSWENEKYNVFGQAVMKLGFNIGIKNAHCITAVAQHLKDKIGTQYHRNAILVTAGIKKVNRKTPHLIKNKYGLVGNDYLLFLGRIDPIKRAEWIIDLCYELKNDINIIIAGGAQDAKTESYLNSLKERAGNKSNIIFTGPVDGHEKEELLSNCLLFCLPSSDEGLPLTVLEAIAYERCCVVADIPAYHNIIEHEITGVLFSRNEKKDFIACISQSKE